MSSADEIEYVSCAICGSASFAAVYRDCFDRHHQTPGRFDVVACAKCSLAQTRPRPTRASIASYYPPSYMSYVGDAAVATGTPMAALAHRAACRWRGASFTLHRRRFRPPPRTPDPPHPGARLLDIGTGAGYLVKQMARRGWDVRGIEPDARVARSAERSAGLAPGAITVATIENADFPDRSFDLITMAHVLEHLHDPVEALHQARRWIAERGVLTLWCPNVASIESRVFRRYWFALDVPRHLYHFTPATLGLLLEKTGWRVRRIAGEEQSASLSGSLVHVANAVQGRPRAFRLPRLLHHALEPVAGLGLALGDMPCVHVIAEPR